MISAKRANRIAKSKYPSKRRAQRDELKHVLDLIKDSCRKGHFNCGCCTTFETTHLKLQKLGYDVYVNDHSGHGYGLTIEWD